MLVFKNSFSFCAVVAMLASLSFVLSASAELVKRRETAGKPPGSEQHELVDLQKCAKEVVVGRDPIAPCFAKNCSKYDDKTQHKDLVECQINCYMTRSLYRGDEFKRMQECLKRIESAKDQ
ncbi:hypothetical protein BGX28_002662 [Mortierella sp. GBA30]|nr:hypothetical protein BGX28_002662 [Mortierella sp. GBA30]